jgi:hypothetical protein
MFFHVIQANSCQFMWIYVIHVNLCNSYQFIHVNSCCLSLDFSGNSVKWGEGGRVKYVFPCLQRQLLCQAEGKKIFYSEVWDLLWTSCRLNSTFFPDSLCHPWNYCAVYIDMWLLVSCLSFRIASLCLFHIFTAYVAQHWERKGWRIKNTCW